MIQQSTNLLRNYIYPLYFSRPVNQHIVDFIAGTTRKVSREIRDLVELSFASCHRTTFGHFLAKGVWSESYLWKTMKAHVLQTIENTAKHTASPIFAIYTIAKKTKPSSQAIHPIEATDFHFSHLECKTVWGHQLLCAVLALEAQRFLVILNTIQKQRLVKLIRFVN